MFLTMASGTFRLKSRELYSKGLAKRTVRNIQEVADKSGLTYSTAHRWIENPEKITRIELDNLASFLFDALEMSPEDVLNMRLGDLFVYIPEKKEVAE